MAGSGSNWDKLYKRLDESPVAQAERQHAHKAKLASEARRVFDDWCDKAAQEVLEALRTTAVERCKELERVTSHKVAVTGGTARSADVKKAGMPSSFITLALKEALVHLYAARASGSEPKIHLAIEAEALMPPQSRRAADAAHHRLVSTPLCVIFRASDGRPRLRKIVPGAEPGPLMKLDDVVYRAVEKLIESYEALASTDELYFEDE